MAPDYDLCTAVAGEMLHFCCSMHPLPDAGVPTGLPSETHPGISRSASSLPLEAPSSAKPEFEHELVVIGLELLAFTSFFHPYLREFLRVTIPPLALCTSLLLLDFLCLRTWTRIPARIRANAGWAVVPALILAIAAFAHGDANWPLDRKIAAYAAAILSYAAQMASLYLGVWGLSALASRIVPRLRFGTTRVVLLATLGAFLTLDLGWFNFSLSHISIGYIRLMLTSDGAHHTGMDLGSLVSVGSMFLGFLIATIAPSLLARRIHR